MSLLAILSAETNGVISYVRLMIEMIQPERFLPNQRKAHNPIGPWHWTWEIAV